MKNLKEAFGLQLKELRKSKKYTQEILAEMIDLSPRQLIRIENGEHFPSVETLGKISLVLNISLSSLFNFNWNENTMYFTNDIYQKPSMKLTKKGNEFIIKIYNKNEAETYMELNDLKPENYESKLLEFSKNRNKPITVEFFENKKRTSIKTFFPNLEIKEILSPVDITNSELYDYITSKLKKISTNSNKLNYVKTAINSLEDKTSLKKLSVLIQGMELLL